MSSGAIQYGVPTRDFLLCTSLDTWAQKPKSDSFTWRQKKVNKEYFILNVDQTKKSEEYFQLQTSF